MQFLEDPEVQTVGIYPGAPLPKLDLPGGKPRCSKQEKCKSGRCCFACACESDIRMPADYQPKSNSKPQ